MATPFSRSRAAVCGTESIRVRAAPFGARRGLPSPVVVSSLLSSSSCRRRPSPRCYQDQPLRHSVTIRCPGHQEDALSTGGLQTSSSVRLEVGIVNQLLTAALHPLLLS